MRKTILVIGASSFVGSNLVEGLKDDFRIIATFHDTPVSIPGIFTFKLDVHRKDVVNRLIALIRPDVTIYAAGLSSLTACHTNPKLADALNSAGLINVCSSAERFGSKFIFLSSSYVLAGEDILYKESDTPFPLTVYGGTLASSEFYVQKSCLNYLVFRCCPLYGRSYHPTRRNWFEAMERALGKGLPSAFDDHVLHGALDIQLMVKLVRDAIQENVTNRLFQISSRDHMSRYDLALLYCKLFSRDSNLVTRTQWTLPIDQDQLRMGKMQEKYNFQMDTKNAEAFFNIRFPTIEESMAGTKRRLAGRVTDKL